MAERSNRTRAKPKQKRGRDRAPLVSIAAALVILIVCGLLLGRHYIWDGNEQDESATETEQVPDEQPPETPQSPLPDTPPPDVVEPTPHIKPPPTMVRGMYIDAWTIAREEDLVSFIEICENSEINAIVIDIKDERGWVPYLSDNEAFSAACIGTIPDIEALISRLKNHGIYTIARLVCFKDPLWATRHPNLAIRSRFGSTWQDDKGVAWLDPYNVASWEYLAVMAREAVRVGFDEVQLDYVRFPTDGRLSDIDYGPVMAEKTKAEVIGEFLLYIRAELADTDAWLSADVFGIIPVAPGDFEGIGQDLDIILQNVDFVCPMVYPSHFANIRENGVGQYINGVLFETPDTEPYEVIYNILRMTANRLPADGNHAVVRPYLQAFTAAYLGDGYYIPYTAQEIMDQIQAVYDAGFEEWLLWNHSGVYEIYEETAELLR